MTFLPVSEDHLWALLSSGATLITVNRRLSRYMHQRYALFRMQKGESVWETPDIITFSGWLERSAADRSQRSDASINDRILLHPDQEQIVWESIISSAASGGELLDLSETAKSAREAWELCHAWRVPMEKDLWSTPDAGAFLSWAAQFEERCTKNGWLSWAQLPDAVLRSLEAGGLSVPETIVLAGFDEFSPRDEELLQALSQLGTRIYMLESEAEIGAVQRIVLPDADAEITIAAQWARNFIEKHPDRRVGVIVQDLGERRQSVVRIFNEICHPGSMISENFGFDRAYNISMGRSLSSYPVIRDALRILSLGLDRFSVTDWSELLRSAFLAGAETEMNGRALLDAKIRESGAVGLSISRCRAMLAHSAQKKAAGIAIPAFSKILAEFAEALDRMPARQSLETWANDFSRLLSAAGWPGEKTLSSEAYQAIAAWQDVMAGFAGFGRVSSDRSYAVALSLLSRILSETLFSPEQADVPIQVMGVLEAAGEQFDRLWITGLHHGAWPRPHRPNPFLPIPLQRRMNLPHATPERELSFARTVFDRLLKSAPKVIVSYPASEGDSELSPSPLIGDLPEADIEALDLPERSDYWTESMASAAMEILADHTAPEVEAGTAVSGGTGIMKSQAACPFQAFARYRLGARPLKSPVSGLDAAERGTLVHLALQRLWENLVDSQTLAGLDDAALEERISAAVSAAVGSMAKRHPETFTAVFTEIETRRLHDLLFEWLLLERERAPFSVERKEEPREVDIGGIRLHTVVDRIDRLADGRRVIIDYKTGRPSVNDWLAPRIAEPQLPLYSISIDAPLAGIFFAQVRKGDVKYIGAAAGEGIVPGAGPLVDAGGGMNGDDHLTDLIAKWRVRLAAIADEIRKGHAPVAPVSTADTCRYCELGPFCRIGMVPESEDDEPDENESFDY